MRWTKGAVFMRASYLPNQGNQNDCTCDDKGDRNGRVQLRQRVHFFSVHPISPIRAVLLLCGCEGARHQRGGGDEGADNANVVCVKRS